MVTATSALLMQLVNGDRDVLGLPPGWMEGELERTAAVSVGPWEMERQTGPTRVLPTVTGALCARTVVV